MKQSIEDLDRAVGALQQKLVELKLDDNTILWFTSDNGPENGMNSPNESTPQRSVRTAGLRLRKRSLFEGGIRVPSLVQWPAQLAGNQQSSYLASTHDILPTLAELVEVPLPDGTQLDGASIAGALRGTADQRQTPVGFLFQKQSAWIEQRYKLINPGDGWQLFDLQQDPGERAPLLRQADLSEPSTTQENEAEFHQKKMRTMIREFEKWQANVVGQSSDQR